MLPGKPRVQFDGLRGKFRNTAKAVLAPSEISGDRGNDGEVKEREKKKKQEGRTQEKVHMAGKNKERGGERGVIKRNFWDASKLTGCRYVRSRSQPY